MFGCFFSVHLFISVCNKLLKMVELIAGPLNKKGLNKIYTLKFLLKSSNKKKVKSAKCLRNN